MEMRIQPFDPKMIGSENVLVVMHKGKTLVWDIPPKDLSFNFDVFEQINGYWAQCRMQTQDDIFDTYEKIYRIFQNITDFKKLLLQDEREIARNLTRQLITYATAAPVRFSDRAAVDRMLDAVKATDPQRKQIRDIADKALRGLQGGKVKGKSVKVRAL